MRRFLPSGFAFPSRRLRYAGRRVLIWLLVAVVLGSIPLADHLGLFGRRPAPDHEKYDGNAFYVVRVVDGDTLDVDVPDGRTGRRTTRIRLWGVDTPETVDPRKPRPDHFGPEASAFTKSLAEHQWVRLQLEPVETRDHTDGKRLLAWVYLPDGRLLNRVLVEDGYAYADPRFPHGRKREFEKLMKQAKTEGRGLWKDVRPEDLPNYLHERLSGQ